MGISWYWLISGVLRMFWTPNLKFLLGENFFCVCAGSGTPVVMGATVAWVIVAVGNCPIKV